MDKFNKYGVVCAAINCPNKQYNCSLSFFTFPRDLTRARMWFTACGREDLREKEHKLKSYRLCSAHFEDKMYTSAMKTRLLPVAVPTIFPFFDREFYTRNWQKEHNYALQLVYRLENFSIPVVELGFTKANSNNLPRMDLITIMEYFHENNNSITNEIKRLKSQTTGSQTYGDDAIRYVQVKHSPLLCEVKASVRPEYDINAKNYDVSCRINTVEDIVIEAKCADCIVNKGGCIHCVAFLMWLHRRNEDPPYGEEVNFWKNNDSTYNSLKRKDAAEGSVLRKYIESEQRKIENKMYTCQDPKFASLSIHSIGMNLRKSSNTKGESFKKFCEKHVDPKLILKVEEVTRNQSDSSLWQEMRYGRVTSSKALHVIKCETIDELEELEENILGTIISDSEKLEMKNKVLKMLSSETSMQFFKTGILLSSDHPFVEATPDAINDTYVVEIKFPNSEESLPFYYDSTGNIKLKYVYQMQLQMLLAKKEKGILVIAQKDFESSGKLIIKCCTYSTCVTNSILNGINEFWIKHIYNKVS